jgi:hypothetical protein
MQFDSFQSDFRTALHDSDILDIGQMELLQPQSGEIVKGDDDELGNDEPQHAPEELDMDELPKAPEAKDSPTPSTDADEPRSKEVPHASTHTRKNDEPGSEEPQNAPEELDIDELPKAPEAKDSPMPSTDADEPRSKDVPHAPTDTRDSLECNEELHESSMDIPVQMQLLQPLAGEIIGSDDDRLGSEVLQNAPGELDMDELPKAPEAKDSPTPSTDADEPRSKEVPHASTDTRDSLECNEELHEPSMDIPVQMQLLHPGAEEIIEGDNDELGSEEPQHAPNEYPKAPKDDNSPTPSTHIDDLRSAEVLPDLESKLGGDECERPIASDSFSVTVEKLDGDKLGIGVLWRSNGKLAVQSVTGGIVQAWNEKHPKEQVSCGDRLIGVNGIYDDPSRMLEECQQIGSLHLVFSQAAEIDTCIQDNSGQEVANIKVGSAASEADGAPDQQLRQGKSPSVCNKRHSDPAHVSGLSLDGDVEAPELPIYCEVDGGWRSLPSAMRGKMSSGLDYVKGHVGNGLTVPAHASEKLQRGLLYATSQAKASKALASAAISEKAQQASATLSEKAHVASATISGKVSALNMSKKMSQTAQRGLNIAKRLSQSGGA